MKEFKRTVLMILAVGFVLTACKKDDDDDDMMDVNPEVTTQSFTVTIENNQTAYEYFGSGVFNTPVGATEPGGAGPGNSYEFTVNAGPGHKLSFATMFVGSNDLFFAPNGGGIELFNGNTPVTGDVTSQIALWDAGTEVNQMPGSGSDQPMNQMGPNTGAAENGNVLNIDDVTDGFTYPSVASAINVSIAAGISVNEFVITIENLAGSMSPIAPGVWVVHSGVDPLFDENNTDYGNGLEHLAEDGDPSVLAGNITNNTGLNTPFAPGVYAIHSNGNPMITTGNDATAGLEKLAEDGDPSMMLMGLAGNSIVSQSAVFNTPDGGSAAAPIFPGESYSFTFTADQGDYLSLGTMFIQSNDLFYGFDEGGINLWSGSSPISGDVTSSIVLWDSGTEENEFPGAGLNQAPRQAGANTGEDEGGSVVIVNDGFEYPSTVSSIKVTISLN